MCVTAGPPSRPALTVCCAQPKNVKTNSKFAAVSFAGSRRILTARKCCAGVLAAFFSLAVAGSFSRAAEFAFGADLSFLKQAEDRGTVFKDGTNALPGLQIFKNHGYNWIRLRIFVEPVGGGLPNDLKYTLALALDAKKLGYKFLLDFHYANSWADPGQQPTPAAWKDLSHVARVEKVFSYTRDTMRRQYIWSSSCLAASLVQSCERFQNNQ